MKFFYLFLLFSINCFSLVIDNGDVVLNNTYNANQGDIIINGGSLLLGNSNLIQNRTNMELNGGSFLSNGFDDKIGQLTLSANSIIDLGSYNSNIKFDSLLYSNGTLVVDNWNKPNQLKFSNTNGLTSVFLNNVTFVGYGQGAMINGNSIVPISSAIPESDNLIIGIIIVLFVCIIEIKMYLTNR